ncbi:MAG: hypothetical protein R3F02_11400 [Thiolinea sp.]
MSLSTTETKLRQRSLLFGNREFIIRNNEFLLIRETSLFRRHETLIPLKALQATPTYSSSFSIKWLFNSLLALALGILFFYWADRFTLPILYIPGAVFLATTLLFVYRFFLYTTRLTIFRHATNNENYLFLWRNRPDKQKFEQFIQKLSRLILDNSGQ